MNLNLTLEEVNAILVSLGQMPYVQVCQLVEKIKEQATPQVNDETLSSE